MNQDISYEDLAKLGNINFKEFQSVKEISDRTGLSPQDINHYIKHVENKVRNSFPIYDASFRISDEKGIIYDHEDDTTIKKLFSERETCQSEREKFDCSREELCYILSERGYCRPVVMKYFLNKNRI